MKRVEQSKKTIMMKTVKEKKERRPRKKRSRSSFSRVGTNSPKCCLQSLLQCWNIYVARSWFLHHVRVKSKERETHAPSTEHYCAHNKPFRNHWSIMLCTQFQTDILTKATTENRSHIPRWQCL